MTAFTEAEVEQVVLNWIADFSWRVAHKRRWQA